MTYYRTDPGPLGQVFTSTSGHATTSAAAHKTVSSDLDSLRSLFSGDACAPIAAALSAAYNRVLTVGMTGATQQVQNAVTGGREAMGHITAGAYQMVANAEKAAHDVDPIAITDGKSI